MTLIDTHVHVWDPAGPVDYPWLTEALPALYRSFQLSDVETEMAAMGVVGTVLVQASDSLAETAALLAAAAAAPPQRPARVVGWLPLADADAARRALDSFADPALVGVRHLIHDEPDPRWMLRPDVTAGMAVLDRAGLVFDAVAERAELLAQVPAAARRYPGLTVVLDHLGKPPLTGSAAEWRTWRSRLAAAAEPENVVAKLSGLNTVAPRAWSAADLSPAVEVALEVFGPRRLMIGGDWPFALLAPPLGVPPGPDGRFAGAYTGIVGALAETIGRLSPAERRHIRVETARRVYRLPATAPDDPPDDRTS